MASVGHFKSVPLPAITAVATPVELRAFADMTVRTRYGNLLKSHGIFKPVLWANMVASLLATSTLLVPWPGSHVLIASPWECGQGAEEFAFAGPVLLHSGIVAVVQWHLLVLVIHRVNVVVAREIIRNFETRAVLILGISALCAYVALVSATFGDLMSSDRLAAVWVKAFGMLPMLVALAMLDAALMNRRIKLVFYFGSFALFLLMFVGSTNWHLYPVAFPVSGSCGHVTCGFLRFVLSASLLNINALLLKGIFGFCKNRPFAFYRPEFQWPDPQEANHVEEERYTVEEEQPSEKAEDEVHMHDVVFRKPTADFEEANGRRSRRSVGGDTLRFCPLEYDYEDVSRLTEELPSQQAFVPSLEIDTISSPASSSKGARKVRFDGDPPASDDERVEQPGSGGSPRDSVGTPEECTDVGPVLFHVKSPEQREADRLQELGEIDKFKVLLAEKEEELARLRKQLHHLLALGGSALLERTITAAVEDVVTRKSGKQSPRPTPDIPKLQFPLGRPAGDRDAQAPAFSPRETTSQQRSSHSGSSGGGALIPATALWPVCAVAATPGSGPASVPPTMSSRVSLRTGVEAPPFPDFMQEKDWRLMTS